MISLITFGLEEDGNTPSLCICHIPQAPRKNNYFNRKDKVSMKALLPKPEGYVERPKRNFDRNNKRGGYNKNKS